MYVKNTTSRLVLRPIELEDAVFLVRLMNSEGWLRFIGDRNIRDAQQAMGYINTILENPTSFYHIIQLQSNGQPIGVISFLTRIGLPYPDIGFALLPKFEKKGYAFEASQSYLLSLEETKNHQNIIAILEMDNARSMRLLQKLGFGYLGKSKKEKTTIAYYGLKQCNPFWE